MKNKMKKIMMMALALLLLIGAFPVSASAAGITLNMGKGWIFGSHKVYDPEYIYGNGWSYPYRKGYAFDGFSYDKKGKKIVKSEEEVRKKASNKKSGNITIYARWTKKCYRVTFVPGKHGTIEGDFKNSKYIGATHKKITRYVKKGKELGSVIYPATYADNGYKFVGWYSDKKFKHKVCGDWIDLVGWKPRRNTTLYAKYKKIS